MASRKRWHEIGRQFYRKFHYTHAIVGAYCVYFEAICTHSGTKFPSSPYFGDIPPTWYWRVYDERDVVVAEGLTPTLDTAKASATIQGRRWRPRTSGARP